MSIKVKIREGYKPEYHFGNPYYYGELFAIEDSGCWVNFDGCTNANFEPSELFLPVGTTKEELIELINKDTDSQIAKTLVLGLLRSRRRK